MWLPISATLCTCLLLAACGGDKTAAHAAAQSAEGDLPKPEAASGSVTGMPNPGAPLARPASNAALPDRNAANGIGESIAEEPPRPTDPPSAEAEGVDAALLVLRTYYSAINARDYAKAYQQWGDDGRASGQSPQLFADGFRDTLGVSVVFGEPGQVEGAAGSRYIEIPATLDATQADNSIRHYTGSFTLRMSMVDGASESQRSWHITTASLREVRP